MTTPPTTRLPRNRLPATMTLAGWQLRQTGRQLALLGFGLFAIVVLITSTLLFGHLAVTAGLRSFVDQPTSNLEISLNYAGKYTNQSQYQVDEHTINQIVQQQIGPYLDPQINTSMKLPLATLVPPGVVPGTKKFGTLTMDFAFIGMPITQVGDQLKVSQGRLPASTSSSLELALTLDEASYLHIAVGDAAQVALYDANDPSIIRLIPVRIVGIFTVLHPNELYWSKNSFQYSPPQDVGPGNASIIPALVSDQMLQQIITQEALQRDNNHPNGHTPSFHAYLQAQYFFHINIGSITADALPGIISRFDTLSALINNDAPLPDVTGLQLNGTVFDPNGVFAAYSDRVNAATIPLAVIVIGLIGLSLFFTALMADLLIERQAGTIAAMRSRGFSRWQIFWSLLLEVVGVGLLALGAGLALTIPLVRLLSTTQLAAFPDKAQDLLQGPLLAVVGRWGWVAVATVGCSLGALAVALIRASGYDVLSIRQEATRTRGIVLWQRLRLDVIAAIIALLAYGISLYIAEIIGPTDPQVTRLLGPIALLSPVFLVLAVLLIFLRLVPILLRWGARLAARGRGAIALLALAQVARNPRQAMRLVLLLALTNAFVVVLLAFTASQNHRANDVAAYATGADFRGSFAYQSFKSPDPSQNFLAIPGVVAAAAGVMETTEAKDFSIGGNFALISVNPDTYRQVAVWPQPGLADHLLDELVAARGKYGNGIGAPIPAIVDANTWTTLHLATGAVFLMREATTQIFVTLVALDHTASIPMAPIGQGAILVDETAFRLGPDGNLLNTMWLRTQGDAASLQQVRAALNAKPTSLAAVLDRRALIASMQIEPLGVTLNGLALIGVGIPLLLALIGCFFASWNQVRQRLAGLATLRAIGATPPQILGMLQWELGLEYLTALVLGGAFGLFLAQSLIPNLVFTNVSATSAIVDTTNSQNYYVLQNTPPVAVHLDLSVVVALGISLVIGVLVLGYMTISATRAAIGNTLRVSED